MSEQKKLSKWDLLSLSVGQVVGAGVITLIGPAISMTGRSAYIAYAMAIFFGFLVALPYIILTSCVKLTGGEYHMNAMVGGTLKGGMYITAYITQAISCSLMGVSLGTYLNAIFPSLDRQIVAILAITLFYILNLFSIDVIAKVQKFMVVLLIGCLLMFIVVGIPRLNTSLLSGAANAEEFMVNGSKGMWKAMFLCIFSCTGYKLTMAYGGKAENPTKDIPWAMLMTIPIILVIYVGIAIIACGILPFDVISKETLTGIAKSILPTPLFILFMVGGPIMCLTTTLNATFSSNAIQFGKATRDGWFPAVLGKTNRYGSSWIILTIIYAISMIPILLKFSITIITNNLTLILYILFFLSYSSIWTLPKKFPEEFKNSWLHIPVPMFYGIMLVSYGVVISVLINKLQSLKPVVSIVSIAVMAVCMVVAYFRYKSGKIHIDNSRQ